MQKTTLSLQEKSFTRMANLMVELGAEPWSVGIVWTYTPNRALL